MVQKNLSIAKFLLTVKDYENFNYNTGNVIVIYSHQKSTCAIFVLFNRKTLSLRKKCVPLHPQSLQKQKIIKRFLVLNTDI